VDFTFPYKSRTYTWFKEFFKKSIWKALRYGFGLSMIWTHLNWLLRSNSFHFTCRKIEELVRSKIIGNIFKHDPFSFPVLYQFENLLIENDCYGNVGFWLVSEQPFMIQKSLVSIKRNYTIIIVLNSNHRLEFSLKMNATEIWISHFRENQENPIFLNVSSILCLPVYGFCTHWF
jgi:hypothetical protein